MSVVPEFSDPSLFRSERVSDSHSSVDEDYLLIFRLVAETRSAAPQISSVRFCVVENEMIGQKRICSASRSLQIYHAPRIFPRRMVLVSGAKFQFRLATMTRDSEIEQPEMEGLVQTFSVSNVSTLSVDPISGVVVAHRPGTVILRSRLCAIQSSDLSLKSWSNPVIFERLFASVDDLCSRLNHVILASDFAQVDVVSLEDGISLRSSSQEFHFVPPSISEKSFGSSPPHLVQDRVEGIHVQVASFSGSAFAPISFFGVDLTYTWSIRVSGYHGNETLFLLRSGHNGTCSILPIPGYEKMLEDIFLTSPNQLEIVVQIVVSTSSCGANHPLRVPNGCTPTSASIRIRIVPVSEVGGTDIRMAPGSAVVLPIDSRDSASTSIEVSSSSSLSAEFPRAALSISSKSVLFADSFSPLGMGFVRFRSFSLGDTNHMLRVEVASPQSVLLPLLFRLPVGGQLRFFPRFLNSKGLSLSNMEDRGISFSPTVSIHSKYKLNSQSEKLSGDWIEVEASSSDGCGISWLPVSSSFSQIDVRRSPEGSLVIESHAATRIAMALLDYSQPQSHSLQSSGDFFHFFFVCVFSPSLSSLGCFSNGSLPLFAE